MNRYSYKLKCLYVDIPENELNFKLPYDIPPRVAKGMIIIAENQISDTSILRDSFRRDKTDRLSNDILAIMVRDQEIREIDPEAFPHTKQERKFFFWREYIDKFLELKFVKLE